MELGRRPTLQEWLATARFESRFLLLAVPPLVVLFGLDLFGVSLTDAIRVVVLLEALSLGFWAVLPPGMQDYVGGRSQSPSSRVS